MRHHTKDKGDRGVAFVIADLARHGIDVALPISEHQPYDLIAVSRHGETRRMSVKYRATNRGCVEVRLQSSWSDRHGTHIRAHQKGDYDGTAIYCPETDRCYYVRMDEVVGKIIILRVVPTRNNQKAGVTLADGFIDPVRLFNAPVAQSG